MPLASPRRRPARVGTAALVGSIVLGMTGVVVDAAAQEPPRYSTRVDLATVPFRVTLHGRPVPNLSAKDVRVLEHGAERDLQFLLAPADSPLEIALLLDVSGSMAPHERRRPCP